MNKPSTVGNKTSSLAELFILQRETWPCLDLVTRRKFIMFRTPLPGVKNPNPKQKVTNIWKETQSDYLVARDHLFFSKQAYISTTHIPVAVTCSRRLLQRRGLGYW
jgi:hypothetical protein